MTNRQLPFDLKAPPAMGAADFVTSSSNDAALALIDSWPNWPGPALSVHGPAGCGKTHLGHVWQEKVGAQALFLDAPTTLPDLPSPPMLILDEPALDETEFFHLPVHPLSMAMHARNGTSAPAPSPANHTPEIPKRLAFYYLFIYLLLYNAYI